MKTPEIISIKLVAHWNTYIFSPEWINKYIVSKFTPETKQVEIFANFMDRDYGYNIAGIQLIPKDTVLEIKINKDEIEKDYKKLVIMNLILLEILFLLPHTPLTAIGINVDYNLPLTEKNLIVDYFNNVKEIKLNDFNTQQVRISKKIENYNLNLIVTSDGDLLKINFNYYFNPPFSFNENIINKLIEITELQMEV